MACMCCNTINVDNIQTCKLQSNAFAAESIVANNICAQQIDAKILTAENETANNICAQKVQAVQSWSDSSYNNNLFANNASINNLCATNFTAINSSQCNIYRAAVTLGGDLLYNLGSLINWDTILDDPNGNVSLSPFAYTVDSDQGGYYLVTLHINNNSLSGSSPITGAPTGLLTILVNGVRLRSEDSAWLAFSDQQAATLAALVLLNGGDVITMKYDVLVQGSSGVMPYVGTVMIQANGTFPGESGFSIIQLSTFCAGSGPNACPIVPPVEIPCGPVQTPCNPVMVPCCVPGQDCMPR